MKYFFVLFTCYVGMLQVIAQIPFTYAAYFGDAHGLTRRPVTAVCIASDQSVWVGTADGIFLFESGRFFPADTRLSPGSIAPRGMILKMVYDSVQECIWIATDGDGLHKLDICTRSIHMYPSSSDDTQPGPVITGILPVEDGLWVGTRSRGLFFLETGTQQFYRIASFPKSMPVSLLMSVSAHELLVGTPGYGLYRLQKMHSLTRIYQAPDFLVSGLQLSATTFVFAGENRICTLDIQSGICGDAAYTPCSRGSIRSILHLPEGQLLIQTSCGLLIKHSNGRWEKPIAPTSVETGGGYTLILDARRQLWAGFESGLGVLNLEQDVSLPHPVSSGYSADIFTVYEDAQGVVYAGASGSGLWKQVKKDSWIQVIPELDVLSIHEFQQALWVATYGQGIHQIKRNTISKAKAPDFVYSFASEDQHTLWAGTEQQGIWRYQGSVWEAIPETKGQSCATLIPKGKWIYYAGFEEGLGILNVETREVRFFRPPGTDTWVQAVYPADSGYLWVCMYGEGLWRFEISTQSWCMPNSGKTFMQSIVSAVVPNGAGWWVTTHEGIWWLQPSGGLMRWRLHAQQPFPEFNAASAIVLRDGRVLAGGPKGLWQLPRPTWRSIHSGHDIIFRMFHSGRATGFGSLCHEGGEVDVQDFPLALHWSVPVQAQDIKWKFRIKELNSSGMPAIPNEIIHIPWLPEGDWTIEIFQVNAVIPIKASFPIRVKQSVRIHNYMNVYVVLAFIITGIAGMLIRRWMRSG